MHSGMSSLLDLAGSCSSFLVRQSVQTCFGRINLFRCFWLAAISQRIEFVPFRDDKWLNGARNIQAWWICGLFEQPSWSQFLQSGDRGSVKKFPERGDQDHGNDVLRDPCFSFLFCFYSSYWFLILFLSFFLWLLVVYLFFNCFRKRDSCCCFVTTINSIRERGSL